MGKQLDLSDGDSNIWNDPFNPKWYSEEINNYDENDYEVLNKKIKNYIENNKGRKSYLEYCDNNSQTINAIRNFDPNLDDSF